MTRLDAAFEVVAIDSVSRNESNLATYVEATLRAHGSLDVERVGDNVIARTTGPRTTRVIVAGHLDTVPGDASTAYVEGDVLYGVGACDMKGSLSVMLEIAKATTARSVEVTWVFYAREEISRAESGLTEIFELRPDLMAGDLAILAEPTGGAVEAGCQGSMRVEITLYGRRAHTSRPFTGLNAIHRAGALIERVASYVPRSVEIDGITFTEQLQVVNVSGGVAPNVVPDEVQVVLNHRVAPDRTRTSAEASLRELLDGFLNDDDLFQVTDFAPPTPPSLDDPRLRHLIELTGQKARAKVGWTDVATFFERGVPATNFGAGDPLLAHRSDEYVTRDELDAFATTLMAWLA
ncbi:MAG: succinyl-diaminopimelate desuccinylase [Actinobacteria bacterium 21-64-8]|nr:MAG: succinyl-diaminopimelate desuccinylase [Actinobacteria bacterium 21-64-8]